MYILSNSHNIHVVNTRPDQALGAAQAICAAYGVSPQDYFSSDCLTLHAEHIRRQIERFPEGQFVALDGDKVIGTAVTMRTDHPPTAKPHTWLDQLGGLYINNHTSTGRWLYGVEFAVNPAYRKQGVGTLLYQARFDMVKRLGLDGFYAVGMLMGYKNYAHEMSVREYGEKVMRRELIDPTVTMQMNRGFRPIQVVEHYLDDEPDAGNAGVLIVWDNPALLEREKSA